MLPTQQPRVQILAPQIFFLLTAYFMDSIEIEPSSVKLWISQMQLAVTSRAKYGKKISIQYCLSML